ncbi:hypothetical protein GCM10011575_43990 [Microlunatus endophyticus]|uniref:Uncharacterized protein n=1 Tax=Microlunatus endophyticus TaxID=1716077 RepID=A0A917SIF4_9ACTN|nr:hypothetical protein GCM10011575_43990 [Microlunatus endophyticus]
MWFRFVIFPVPRAPRPAPRAPRPAPRAPRPEVMMRAKSWRENFLYWLKARLRRATRPGWAPRGPASLRSAPQGPTQPGRNHAVPILRLSLTGSRRRSPKPASSVFVAATPKLRPTSYADDA